MIIKKVTVQPQLNGCRKRFSAMLSDPVTLYKLMNLYMLKKVNFPISNAQLTDFFLQHEYTSYFTLQQALSELEESGLIQSHSTHNSTQYEITREGEDTLGFFIRNIPPAIINDMDAWLKENRFHMRSEVGVQADYYRSTNQDYIVHCEVREQKSILLDLDISVPDLEQAEAMCARWKDRSQAIYAYIMKALLSE